MLSGLHPPHFMSGPSGLLRTAGKESGPGGKGMESLQVPSGWQVDLAVTFFPAAFVQAGQLREDFMILNIMENYLRSVTSSMARDVFFVGVESFTPPASMVSLR